MGVDESRLGVPRWAVVALVAAIGLSVVYGVVIIGSVAAPLRIWLNLVEPAVLVVAVFLLYRFVVAVETIAEKL